MFNRNSSRSAALARPVAGNCKAAAFSDIFIWYLSFLVLRQVGSTVLRIQWPVRRQIEFPSQDFGGGHIFEYALNDRSHVVPARFLEMPGCSRFADIVFANGAGLGRRSL